jgi:bacterial/archaeal transporter family protein
MRSHRRVSIIQRRNAMPDTTLAPWLLWALLSAAFAALTAIFAKVGVASINSDFATLLRTIVVLAVLAAIVVARGAAQPLATISARTYAFLGLSGLATGASWLCYFRALQLGEASRVAPVDKLSVVLVALFGVVFLGEHLSVHNWLGVALIASGVILLALP